VRSTWPLVVLLAGWSAWTLLHAPLSHRLGFSPWKLGGMGMFADHGDWLDGSVYIAVIDADPGLDLASAERAVVERLRDERLRQGWAMDHALIEHLSLSDGECVVRPLPDSEALDDAHEGVLLWPRERSIHRLVEAAGGDPRRQWLVARAVSGWQDGQTFALCTWRGEERRCVSFRRDPR
jgi:hypothetical protein